MPLFNKKTECPIDRDMRLWIEHTMGWLTNKFTFEHFFAKPTLTPTPEHFPVQLDGSEQMAFNLLNIVCKQIDVDPNNVTLEFYTDHLMELNSGSISLFSEQIEDESYSAGLYSGKSGEKFMVAIERGQLRYAEKLVATLAHELAHVKILGENRLQENYEDLTDLTTVFFGLGIFNANASYHEHRSVSSWGYSRQGYLTQQEWGYALAIYAFMKEVQAPEWIRYLSKNILSDYKKAEAFIYDNHELILNEPLDENADE